MNGMTLSGRRAEVLWTAGSFITGAGQQRQYDAFIAGPGFLIPLHVSKLVHVWDIPMTRFGECKAIRLRPDPEFKRKVQLTNRSILGAIVLLIACPFLWLGVHWLLGILTLVPGVALAVLAFMSSRDHPRDRMIRLLLGPHTWGSSDPATWHESICSDVVDPQVLKVDSFAALAQEAIEAEKWGYAMWAARLCVAVENKKVGEALTDEILNDQDVRERLRIVSRNPSKRNGEFGKPPKLKHWINCDPEDHIFAIG